MEPLEREKFRVEIGVGLPSGLVVASPRDEVLELVVADPGIEVFFNKPFLSIVDNDGRSRRLEMPWEGVGVHRLQKEMWKTCCTFMEAGKLRR